MNPKVNRGVALIGSNPTIAHRIPKEHAINPLIIDFPVNPATKVKANKTTKVNSVGPNFRANFEKGAATTYSKISAIIAPATEANSAIWRASLALPFFANGKPSKEVAEASGDPGIFKRIAEIDPPKVPPLYIPIKKAIAVIGCIPKVIGAKRAIAIAAVRPGIAPIKIPIVTPAISAISGPNVSAFCIPIIRFSIDR